SSYAVHEQRHRCVVVLGPQSVADDRVDEPTFLVINGDTPLPRHRAVGERDHAHAILNADADDPTRRHAQRTGLEVTNHGPHVVGAGVDDDLGTNGSHGVSPCPPAWRPVLNILALTVGDLAYRIVRSAVELVRRPD